MRRGVILVSGIVLTFLLIGCGQSTPDTEGQTLAQARQSLSEVGVPDNNISVTGESGDENSLIVCDHDPDNVDPSEPVTLEVAQDCPDDDSDKKKKKRSGGSKRR